MATKVLITPRSYGKANPALFDMLAAKGVTVVRNETGGIMSKAQMLSAVAGCEGVILGVDPMDADVIAASPHLRAIAKYGVGVDNIDLDAAKARGIAVSRTIGANSEAVADYAFALMIALARKVPAIDRQCRQRDWKKVTTIDISHATVGILGFGAIGKNVAKRCRGFDMRILAHDVFWDEAAAQALGVTRAEPETIYREADFISVHLPLLPETRGCIGAREIALMKPTAILVNTARGGIVDEAALLDALQTGRLYGAGVDAFEQEPPENPAWYMLDNLIMGSHCAASTAGASNNMGLMATNNLIRDLGL